jgi:Domain of unknown function (DUF4157)
MSSDPRAKIFASLQAEDKPDFKYPQPRRFRPSDYDISEREMQSGLYERIPPDPEKVQQLLERLQARYGTMNVTFEEFQRRFIEQHGQKNKAEVEAWKAKKAAKALEQEQKASEARVEQNIDAAMGLKDEALFGTNALHDLASVLEEEDQFVQEIQTQTETLKTAVQNITTTAKTLEPEIKPEISSAVQHQVQQDLDLHAQLEQAIGETLPLFNIQTDAEADLKAKAIGAIAFTQGDTIYFQSGKFDPTSVEGFKLLVHEATHIGQQAKGIVSDGIDSSPELEAQAQQKADAVSSPAKTFTNPELMVFANQLKAQYAQQGRNPERFEQIAETWRSMPGDAQNKIRSRFFLGMNDNALETIKLREAFNSRLNAGFETTTAKLESPFLKPSGINIAFETPRTQLEPNKPVISADRIAPTTPIYEPPSSARGYTGMTRSLRASSRALQRQQDPAKTQAQEPTEKEVAKVNAVGRVFNNGGVNVYTKPNTSGQGTPSTKLEFNAVILVIREVQGGWYQISFTNGNAAQTGFVNKSFVRVYKDDPGAKLQKVTRGQSAIGIAEAHYKQFIQPGEDLRFFVNVLAHLNPNALDKPNDGNWRSVGFKADTTIYIPSASKAISLRGTVDDGSITNGMVARVQEFGKRIGDVISSAVNSPQFIGEVLGDLWEVVKENWVSILAVTTGLIAAELVVGALAVIPEPTLITKLIALLLQGIIVLICGYGVITGIAGVASEGKNWISTAWTANGDAAKLKQASKAFLRMMGHIALTALSVLGLRGNLGKFNGLYAKYKPKLPKVASGVKEDPGQLVDAAKQGILSLKQQELLNRLAAQDSLGKGLASIGAREVTATDLAALTTVTGREFAIVILNNGQRVLVDMGSYKGGALPVNTKTLLIHSHPSDRGSGMAKFVSKEDVEALIYLGQHYSYIVMVDGSIYKFTASTAPMSIGEVVRQPHPFLGWVSPKK